MKHIADQPSDAVERRVLCTAGDLIVTATDGLFDNVPDEVILERLNALPETDEIRTKGMSSKESLGLAGTGFNFSVSCVRIFS